ncbi:grpE protein homolog 1, mitochondrial [Patella vulgata]|uniref:grpE protein homolog 1, mitochondrial n=1 Tax=Patella vulgata TaxID=6465 RepID=UPI00218038C6|nr:grpE protein homolog 1, mitochondrial [Patella vulgata]
MASVGGMCVRSLYKISRHSQYLLHIQPARNRSLRLSTTSTNGKTDETEGEKEQKQPEIAENEQKLVELNKKYVIEIAELKDKYIRSLAETENVRKRMMKQIEDAKIFGIQGFCKDLLEVADILGAATESVPKDQLTKENIHLKNLFDGLTMTESQLQKVFTKNGLVKVAPGVGEKFDPFVHEALFEVPTTEKEKGTIAVLQKTGYRLKDRTIRPALVGVFKTG